MFRGRGARHYSGSSRLYTRFIVAFIVVAIILIFFIFYFSLSKALIRVTPRISTVTSDFIADIETSTTTPSPGAIAGLLYETEVTAEETYDATGTKDVEGNIIGTVTLHNNLNRNQPLIQRTRLLTDDGVLLRMSERADIPAGGSVDVSVYADDPSSFESLPPTVFTIPGLSASSQTKVYAESSNVIRSKPGSIKVVKAVDIARAKEAIDQELSNKAIASFQKEVSEGYVGIVVSQQVLNEDVSASVDTVSETFTISKTMHVTIVGINQSDIVTVAADRLKGLVPKNMQLKNLKLDNLSYVVQNFNEQGNTANIKIHAEGETILREDSDILDKSKLYSLSARGVELYLTSFDEIESIDVELNPFWVKKVPSIPDNITIEIVE